nr:hypothetical protein [uncultured Cohaesibacter sp.]
MIDVGNTNLSRDKISEMINETIDLYQHRYEQALLIVPDQYRANIAEIQLPQIDWRRIRAEIEGSESGQEFAALLGRKRILLLDIVHRAAHLKEVYEFCHLDALYLPRESAYLIGCEMVDLFEMRIRERLIRHASSSHTKPTTPAQPPTTARKR